MQKVNYLLYAFFTFLKFIADESISESVRNESDCAISVFKNNNYIETFLNPRWLHFFNQLFF